MKKSIIKWLLLAAAGCAASPLYAATMNITAEFSPDLSNPQKSTFKNTTPISGYCARWPKYCTNDVKSIATTLTTKQQYKIKANDSARNSAYFRIPTGYREVDVTNQSTGEKSTLKFRFAGFSARNYKATNSNWSRTWGNYPPPPCKSGGPAIGGGSWIQFAWAVTDKKDVTCTMTSKIDRPVVINFDQISYSYELISPNPLGMGSGIYTGTLKLGVGPSQSIDFGDNFKANDNFLNVNFTLKVSHELKVSPLPGARDVTLYPCYYKTSCTQNMADKNWERWMVTNIAPQKMSGRSEFNLSSSGSFTVFMKCGSGSPIDAHSCPMTSSISGPVPVKALLTLPENITDQGGGNVINRPLFTEKNTKQNKFLTNAFAVDRKGWVDFVIDQKSIEQMLKTRPDSWGGTVTLIFDPNLF